MTEEGSVAVGNGVQERLKFYAQIDVSASVFLYIYILLHYYYYPLAQQSCGGDIGSAPYVCMCVRTYGRMFTFCHCSSELIYYPISI